MVGLQDRLLHASRSPKADKFRRTADPKVSLTSLMTKTMLLRRNLVALALDWP